MDKPTSLQGLKILKKELESDKNIFLNKEYYEPIEEYKKQLRKKNKIFIKSYDEKINAVTEEIKKKEAELKSKVKFDPKLDRYFKYTFLSGVNFGYKKPSLRYADPSNRFFILTDHGGTAGQGTIMGTGAYYYANCSHFVAFPQYGNFLEAKMPDGGRHNNKIFEVEGGKLTNEIKKNLIKHAEEYCTQYNVPSFILP